MTLFPMPGPPFPHVVGVTKQGDGSRWFAQAGTSAPDGSAAEVNVYWSLPEEGVEPYLVVDVDTHAPVKVTLNDETLGHADQRRD